MLKHKWALPTAFLLTACIPSIAFATAPTVFAGTFSADYSNTNFSGGGGNSDTWGVNGAGAFGFDVPDFAAQIDAGYHRSSASGIDANNWNVGGSVFWAPGTMFRIGPDLSP